MALLFDRIQTDGRAELSYPVGDDSVEALRCLLLAPVWTAACNSPARVGLHPIGESPPGAYPWP